MATPLQAKDYDLLVCPKCTKGMEPVILDFYTDNRDGQDYQKFCWVCPGVEEGSCTFPLDIPTEVFWCRRTRAQAEENILPLPNICLLPEQFRHLYPSIFAQRPTTPQPQQQPEPVVTDERSPGPPSREPPKVDGANTATHSTLKRSHPKPKRGCTARTRAEPVDAKPPQFYTAIQPYPLPSVVASTLPGMYDHLPPQDFKMGLPLAMQVVPPSNSTVRHLLLLPDGQALPMPPPEMSLKEALRSPLYQHYLAYATQYTMKEEEDEEFRRFHEAPPGDAAVYCATPAEVASKRIQATASKKARKRGKITKQESPTPTHSVDTVRNRVSKQLQSRMGTRPLHIRPATTHLPASTATPHAELLYSGGNLNPTVEQWKVAPLATCSGVVSRGSGHQTTISTSLQTRPGSSATSSATNSSREAETEGRTHIADERDAPTHNQPTSRRKRVNTQIGVEGGVGVFGGEPAEESFGDPYIDQLVHEKYKARLMASKRREVGGQSSEEKVEATTQPKAEEPRLVDQYGYAVQSSVGVFQEEVQLEHYAGEASAKTDSFPEGPTSDDDLFDFEF